MSLPYRSRHLGAKCEHASKACYQWNYWFQRVHIVVAFPTRGDFGTRVLLLLAAGTIGENFFSFNFSFPFEYSGFAFDESWVGAEGTSFSESKAFSNDHQILDPLIPWSAIFIKIAPIAHFLEKKRKWLTQNAFYLRKTAIFIKIAPIVRMYDYPPGPLGQKSSAF